MRFENTIFTNNGGGLKVESPAEGWWDILKPGVGRQTTKMGVRIDFF